MFNLRSIGLFALGAVLLVFTACSNDSNVTPEPQEQPQEQAQENTNEQTNEEVNEVINEQPQEDQPQEDQSQDLEEPTEGMPPTSLEAATTVMKILKSGNMNQLAAWAHPEKGIRFSPYAYVDKETDLVFTRDEIESLMKDPTKHTWRTFPGSGDLIELTYADYHKRFVYDADFLTDAEITKNKVNGEGTTVNNLNEVYPADSHDFIEYYIDGIDPAHEGMDWRSLRLVFEKIGYDHILVGIIHDQWTP